MGTAVLFVNFLSFVTNHISIIMVSNEQEQGVDDMSRASPVSRADSCYEYLF